VHQTGSRAETISVALCSYNGGRFIEEQLRSILSQTVLPNEVVIADDGSSDDTLIRARRVTDSFIESNSKPISFVYLKRSTQPLGVAQNFQRALASTTSALVALSDQDDIWAPGRLEALSKRFADVPSLLLLGSGANAIDAEGNALGFTLFEAIAVTGAEWNQLDSGSAYEALLRRNLFTGATMMFRREVFVMAAPFPKYWLHDEWLAIIAAAVGTVELSRMHLTEYRQHGSNVAGIKNQTLRTQAGKISKLFESRGNRNYTLEMKARELAVKLQNQANWIAPDDHAIPSSYISAALQNLAHEEFRRRLPLPRARRIAPIVNELASGNYDLYDYGRKDALRDLLQSR
jgi:glycosyltransferase involved in cell wall biosynthesis